MRAGQADLQPPSVFATSGQRIRAVHPPPCNTRTLCKSSIVHRKSYISAAKRHRPFVTASDHGFTNTRPHLLCSCLKLASRLLLRSRPTTPHPYGAALRPGQTDLQPSSVFTPTGQPCGLAKRPYTVGGFTPAGQKLCFWPNCLTPSAVFTLWAAHLHCPYALTAVVRVVNRKCSMFLGSDMHLFRF